MCRLDVYFPMQMVEQHLERIRKGKHEISREKGILLGILFQRRTSLGDVKGGSVLFKRTECVKNRQKRSASNRRLSNTRALSTLDLLKVNILILWQKKVTLFGKGALDY
ncbi:hypothetical protein TNCT_699931 [Trichonephila clavata]|uniref:Uncharacterized protein n=1 Tax=Trichonephila clavata TaxID=2740835 RepID=A0A8X6G1I7_TRICU|nr:hypothetical protein TNCT_699931 [Trichonephila clavata]